MRNITIPFAITKVDEEKRQVWGVATSDAVDSQGDIIDYDASKKAVADWLKSTANIREMHDSKKAVGKAFDAQFDDANRKITVGAYISRSADGENTWQKVKEGILSAYSVGGSIKDSVLDKAKDAVTGVEQTVNRVTDWTMSELSLVDNPANPDARIVMVKSADGKSLDYVDFQKILDHVDKTIAKTINVNDLNVPAAWWVQKYQNNELTKSAIKEFELNQLEKMEKRDFSDKKRQALADAGKALPDGSFPIENKSDLANAIKAFGRAKDPAKAKAHIIAQAKALGATDLLPDDWNVKSKGADMKKAGINVVDGDPRDATATPVAEATPVAPIRGGTPVKKPIYHVDNTKTDVTKAKLKEFGLTDEQIAEIEKLTPNTVPLPAKPSRVNNPAADDADYDISAGDNDKDEAREDQDGRADAATEQITSDGNEPNKGEVSNPDISDNADGSADAATPTDQHGTNNGTASVSNAEPAAPTSDNATPTADHVDTGVVDGAANAATETNGQGNGKTGNYGGKKTDNGDDDEYASTGNTGGDVDNGVKGKPGRNGRPVADAHEPTDIIKSISDLSKRVDTLVNARESELQKEVGNLVSIVKGIADEQAELREAVSKFAKLPQQVKTQASYTEVVKGKENAVVDGAEKAVSRRDGLTETEIVDLFKRADDLAAHPSAGTPQERGQLFRKLYGLNREDYAHLLSK